MRRLTIGILAFVLIISSALSVSARGDSEGLRFGPYFGPSFPNDAFANVYNVTTESDPTTAFDFASGMGFHVGGRVRFGLTENFSLSGGIAYHRFPNQDMTFTSESGQTLNIKNVSNMIPINAGVIFRMPLSLLEPYVGVGAVFVNQNTTISEGQGVFSQVFSNGQELEPTTNRVGADATVGIGISLIGFFPFIELRSTWANLIGKEDNEPTKSFLSISVGLLF
ncbi:MAG: outer membrane beta-barrel protein [bacterium]|nr:outer membrane beta-barrel protein [bacterium]